MVPDIIDNERLNFSDVAAFAEKCADTRLDELREMSDNASKGENSL